jgi:hypothetical protein
LNKDVLLLWNSNNIYVTANEPLRKEKVKIEFMAVEVDIKMSKYESNFVTVYDGESKITNQYGSNLFRIMYDDKYYLYYRHVKFNIRHQHDYYFHFFQKNDDIFVDIKIKGIDGVRHTENLLPN